MKKIIGFLPLALAISSYAQPKMITQAIITTKTTIVAPEEDENAPAQQTGSGGDNVRIMNFLTDGETKSTTWLKNDIFKTFSENETGRITIIRDNSKKITTTITEMMGKKSGFYITDEDQANMRKRLDSMMQERNQRGSEATREAPKTNIIYFGDSKKIAGYTCNKAVMVTTRANGRSDSSVVWFTPEFKLQGIASTGGSFGGLGNFTQLSATNAMDQLKGFPMQYERNMGRGRKMTVVVTKVVTDKEVEDKEFEIPKDVEMKSAKDMQNGGIPGFSQRRRGRDANQQ
jgi:GLPGLI family protein